MYLTNASISALFRRIELFAALSGLFFAHNSLKINCFHHWDGLYLAEEDEALFAPLNDGAYEPYQIRNIVDRVGGGDSFAGGLIFALNSSDFGDPQLALQFATAASCLKHSIQGDFNFSQIAEVEALMKGSGSGRIVR